MTRIIRTESPASTRKKLLQALLIALRFHRQHDLTDAQRKDVYAFAQLTMRAISRSVDQTASAWEKRDYWLKADRLRIEWQWIIRSDASLETALHNDELATASEILESLEPHLNSISISKKLAKSTPWEGAWKRWKAREGSGEI